VFGPLLTSLNLRNASEPLIRYEAGTNEWHVGVRRYYPYRTRVAYLEADTGETLKILGPST
jgi:hypothetical protein